MTLPKPFELLTLHASVIAAESSAFAPLFGNDGFEMGVTGFTAGLITGAPLYLWWLFRRPVRRR